jgi:DSF synthase
MDRVREICRPISINELMQVTEVWVDTAMQLGDKSLRTMERLVKAQEKRPVQTEMPAARIAPMAFAASN